MNFLRAPNLYRYSPLLVLVLFLRPSLDPLLTKFTLSGVSFGAVINLFIIACLFSILVRLKFKFYKEVVWWVPLLVIMALSLLWTPSLAFGIRATMVAFTYAAMFVIPFHFIKSKTHFIECIRLMLLSAFIPMLFVIYEIFFPAGSTNNNGFRLFGSFTHPNVFAFYLLTIFSVCLYVVKSSAFNQELQLKRIAACLMLVCLVCIVGTKTRTAWAAIAFVILMYGLFNEKRYLLYLLLCSIIALTIPSVQERLLNLTQGTDIDAFVNQYQALNSYTWRKIIWAGAIEEYWQRPWFGFGYQSFMHFSDSFFIIPLEHGAAAHSSFIQLLFELGGIGLFAFILLLLSTVVQLWKLIKLDKVNTVVLSLFIAYILTHYSDNILYYLVFNWYLWFFTGAVMAYSKLKHR